MAFHPLRLCRDADLLQSLVWNELTKRPISVRANAGSVPTMKHKSVGRLKKSGRKQIYQTGNSERLFLMNDSALETPVMSGPTAVAIASCAFNRAAGIEPIEHPLTQSSAHDGFGI